MSADVKLNIEERKFPDKFTFNMILFDILSCRIQALCDYKNQLNIVTQTMLKLTDTLEAGYYFDLNEKTRALQL